MYHDVIRVGWDSDKRIACVGSSVLLDLCLKHSINIVGEGELYYGFGHPILELMLDAIPASGSFGRHPKE